jgi:amidase/6-aminohexanoate-cyclic-dimer hydrolase
VAHASDGGGSIRIPASACGLFGLKPTRGRTPAGPDRGEGWSGMSANHCVSRTVRDSAALLDATMGFAPGDPYDTPPAPGPYLDEAARDPRPLRIALAVNRPTGEAIEPDCERAVAEAAGLLTDLGHEVEDAAPEFDVAQMAGHQLVIIAANVALALRQRSAALGREIAVGDVEAVTATMAEFAKKADSSAYAEALLYIHGLGRQMARFHERYDLLLTSVLGEPPAPIGKFTLDQTDTESYMAALHRYIPFTGLANMTGQPGMSVPLHWSAAGLPIGIHFVGRFGEEHTLFQLAGQLERAKPWAHRRPPVHA